MPVETDEDHGFFEAAELGLFVSVDWVLVLVMLLVVVPVLSVLVAVEGLDKFVVFAALVAIVRVNPRIVVGLPWASSVSVTGCPPGVERMSTVCPLMALTSC